MKGKPANGVGSQYSSHYLGTWGIQHYYRTPRLPVVDRTDAPCRFKWTRPFRRKTKSGFCACAITFQLASKQFLDTSLCWLQKRLQAETEIEGGWGGCWLDTAVDIQKPMTTELNTIYKGRFSTCVQSSHSFYRMLIWSLGNYFQGNY